jgi:Hypervirulence associated proteins TUDOR domain
MNSSIPLHRPSRGSQPPTTTQVHDKEGKPIKQGETVAGKIRGGKHAGEVQAVITDDKEAKEKGVKNPPKVVIEDQHGKD